MSLEAKIEALTVAVSELTAAVNAAGNLPTPVAASGKTSGSAPAAGEADKVSKRTSKETAKDAPSKPKLVQPTKPAADDDFGETGEIGIDDLGDGGAELVYTADNARAAIKALRNAAVEAGNDKDEYTAVATGILVKALGIKPGVNCKMADLQDNHADKAIALCVKAASEGKFMDEFKAYAKVAGVEIR